MISSIEELTVDLNQSILDMDHVMYKEYKKTLIHHKHI